MRKNTLRGKKEKIVGNDYKLLQATDDIEGKGE